MKLIFNFLVAWEGGHERGSERARGGRSMGGDSTTRAWEGQDYDTVQEPGTVQEPVRGRSLGGTGQRPGD